MFRSTDFIFQICNSTSLDTPKEQKEEDGRCSFNTREMLKKAGKCAGADPEIGQRGAELWSIFFA